MVDFRLAVYNEDDIVGAEIRVLHQGVQIDTITVTNPEVISALQSAVASKAPQASTYTKTEVDDKLSNAGGTVTINATSLNGQPGGANGYYAQKVHTHEYAPTSHSSTSTMYGAGTTSDYGHVQLVNNLTEPSYSNGRALSAYQGKVLQTGINNVKTEVENRGGFFIVNTWAVQKNHNLVVDCYNADGTVMTTGTQIELFFKHLGTGNTTTTDLGVSNGKLTIPMSTTGDYLIVFAKKTDSKINKTVMVSVWE